MPFQWIGKVRKYHERSGANTFMKNESSHSDKDYDNFINCSNWVYHFFSQKQNSDANKQTGAVISGTGPIREETGSGMKQHSA